MAGKAESATLAERIDSVLGTAAFVFVATVALLNGIVIKIWWCQQVTHLAVCQAGETFLHGSPQNIHKADKCQQYDNSLHDLPPFLHLPAHFK